MLSSEKRDRVKQSDFSLHREDNKTLKDNQASPNHDNCSRTSRSDLSRLQQSLQESMMDGDSELSQRKQFQLHDLEEIK